ncbi:HNH endonuclease signature motif containing protein, partial [Gordonia sp. N1V]|uniref:HNH endonuclease signature motif containing protein n=1 Tax=Gordonia sp. N1V TaxID=3034163 RepID=UPI0023E1B50E
ALTYAPSAALRAEVLANDAWCRYPYCGMPSHLCDLDHWRPFNHTDPEAGGWTVLGDLIPLCRADHQRKHLAEWAAWVRDCGPAAAWRKASGRPHRRPG